MLKRFFCLFILIFLYQLSEGYMMPASAQMEKDQSKEEDRIKAVEKMFTSPYTEENYYRTDRLLVTATGSQLPVYKAPAVASIITSEDIEKMGATTLDEVLETVPGLHVSLSPKSAARTIYSIRGIHTALNPQVLILMNGIPITNSYDGTRPAGLILPVANISRIEVIRGPGSALHGADAFAGTINVITKDGFELDGTRAGFRSGSFGTYDVWGQHGINWKGWDIALSLEYMETDGDKDRIIDYDFQNTIDGMFGTTASRTPGTMDTKNQILDMHLGLAKDNWTIRLWALDLSGIAGTGAVNILDSHNFSDTEQYLGEINYRDTNLFDDWDLNLRLAYKYLDEDPDARLFPPGARLLIGTDGNIFTPGGGVVNFPDGVIGKPSRIVQDSSIEITGSYSGLNQHRIRLGGGAKYTDFDPGESKNFGPGIINGTEGTVYGNLTDITGTDYIYMPDKNRKLFFTSFQDEWSFAKNWELTTGVRYDHYSDFGTTINPRIALVWETRYDLTTKLLYGRAFRPPSFAELYQQNNPAAVGNKNLDPETINTLELAFDYQPFSNLRAIFSLFTYEVKDLIDLKNNIYQNTKDQKGKGFEVEGDWEITDTFSVKGNFAYQNSEDDDTGETIKDAPGMQFYISPLWNFLENWTLDGQFFWIGDRERANNDLRSDIKDNYLVGLTVRRKNILKYYDMCLAVRNLFDENIQEPTSSAIPGDYPMEGRSVYGEIRFHFK